MKPDIPRRKFRKTLPSAAVCAFLGLAVLYPAGMEAKEKTSPDIVFILLDDLRWDGLSYKGHPYVRTPNIDRLRHEGASMANAFVTTSICCPSRATFLTGTYASTHGVIDNETSEYDPEVTPPVTRYLQEAGYRTAMIGKWHMGQAAHPRPSFDYWLSFKSQGVYFDPWFNINGERRRCKGYTTDLLTDKAIEFIHEQPREEPYFLMLSHKAVHQPFEPAPRHEAAFGAETTDVRPLSWEDDFRSKPEWQRREQADPWRWEWRTRDHEAEKVPEVIPPQPFGNGSHYVQQYRCLAAVDEGIGRLMRTLRKRGTLENTLIVFTSDNGYFHGEHRRWDKRLAYEESLRIPMLILYPGRIEAGLTVEENVRNVDFAPTILSYAGLPVPAQMQGADMRPLLEQRANAWDDEVFYEYWVDLVHSIPTMKALRGKRYKLVVYPEIDDIPELYDLQKDPHEMVNLAGDPAYAEIQSRMTTKLEEKAAQIGWHPRIFPKNLPRFRGPRGKLLEMSFPAGRDFHGKDTAIRLPVSEKLDPGGWPYQVEIVVRPESDGVVLSQAGPRYGYKLFLQNGRPGVSTVCRTWKASRTTIDAPDPVGGEWVSLRAVIDYNRLQFFVDGRLVDSVPLPQPFKGYTTAPLVIGDGSENPVTPSTPNGPFRGSLRAVKVVRER